MSTNLTRRKLWKTAGAALTLIPIVAFTRPAWANINTATRADLKYQGTPKDNMKCDTCLEFVPGKTGDDLGSCKVIAGDDEISPDGYCIRWNTM